MEKFKSIARKGGAIGVVAAMYIACYYIGKLVGKLAGTIFMKLWK